MGWPKGALTCDREVCRIRLELGEEWVKAEPAVLVVIVTGQNLIKARKNQAKGESRSIPRDCRDISLR